MPSLAEIINPSDPSSYRHGDASLKGTGFLGPLKNSQGQMMSEYTISLPINGKDMEIPTLVPTLSKQEIRHLLDGGEITDEIVRKAVNHAHARMSRGMSVFAGPLDAVMPFPQGVLESIINNQAE
jgi:hypothetical protein